MTGPAPADPASTPPDFLGRGWSFPVTVDPTGRIAMTGSDESIRQSIRSILSTAPGERVMRPDFGCAVADLVFAVNDEATAAEVSAAVREALAIWEPRIDVLDVVATPGAATAGADAPEVLLVAVDYEVRATNSRFNLVHPFYLE
jgi:phage baseplate assembly protein W